MSTSIGSTIRFDTHLLEHLPESIKDNPSLEKWVEEVDTKTKSDLAADAIIDLIYKLGRKGKEEILSRAGFSRIKSIIEEIRRFEGLLHYVHSRYSRKIYRDHLDHMLRTALISTFLATDASLSESTKDELVLAALFHDAGYPIQEAGNTLDMIGRSIQVYRLLKFSTTIESIDRDTSRHVQALSAKSGISVENLNADLVTPKHATVGAVIFLDCCKTRKHSKQRSAGEESGLRIASAICLHHSVHNTVIKYDENCLAVLLALGDELQDWGRPTSYSINQQDEITITMPKLKIDSSDNSIDCIFKFRGNRFPCFDVIHNKYLNVKRIRFGDCPTDITFQFPLEKISLSTTLDVLGKSFFDTFSFMPTGIWAYLEPEKEISSTYHGLRDDRVASLVGLKPERTNVIRSIRNYLSSMKRSDWSKKWKLWQYDKSGNFLISQNEPKSIHIKRISDEFKLVLLGKRPQEESGYIIKLNDPIKTGIPSILRTASVVINLLAYVKRRETFLQRRDPNYKSPVFPLEFKDSVANVFWFKRQ